mgnify:CR=1 FL=1
MYSNALILSSNDSEGSCFIIFLCRASETKEDKDKNKNKNKSTTKSRELGEDYYFKERSHGDEEDDNDDRVDVGEGGDYYEKKKSGLFNIFKKR